MSDYEHFDESHISDNVSSLLAINLEVGNYGFQEDDTKILVFIKNTESGQSIIVEAKNSEETISTTIEIKRQYPGDTKPEIIASSTRKINGEKQPILTLWHSHMSVDSAIRGPQPIMNDADLIRVIEYAKSAKERVLARDEKL